VHAVVYLRYDIIAHRKRKVGDSQLLVYLENEQQLQDGEGEGGG
jgi:hypothetical protein